MKNNDKWKSNFCFLICIKVLITENYLGCKMKNFYHRKRFLYAGRLYLNDDNNFSLNFFSMIHDIISLFPLLQNFCIGSFRILSFGKSAQSNCSLQICYKAGYHSEN